MSGSAPTDRPSRPALAALAVGWVIIAVAAVGVLADDQLPRWWTLPVFVVAFDLTHDLVVAPLVFAVGWGLGRFLPSPVRGPARAAAAFSALVTAFAWPSVQRFGERPTNPSALPLDYGRNLAVVLVLTWGVALAVVVLRVLSGIRSRPRPTAGRS